jgi:hypothetical protein
MRLKDETTLVYTLRSRGVTALVEWLPSSNFVFDDVYLFSFIVIGHLNPMAGLLG